MKPTEKDQVPPSKTAETSKRADRAYPVDQESLDKQQQRIRRAAAAGATPLESLRRQPAQPAPAPPAGPAKPVAAEKNPSPGKPAAGQYTKGFPEVARQTPAPSPTPRPTAAPKQEPVAKPEEPKPAFSAPRKAKIRFILLEPKAKHVLLSGEFTGWAAKAVPMQRGADGHWETTIALAPGRYEYKFIVDGQWIPDPMAQEVVWNTHGTLNSVIVVRDF